MTLFIIAALAAVILAVGYEAVTGQAKVKARLLREFGVVPSGDYRHASVGKYWQAYRAANAPADAIDDTTWDDLTMEEVYYRVCNCTTTVGQDYLYALLHMPCDSGEREKLIALFEDAGLRLSTQLTLAKLGKKICANLDELLFASQNYALDAPWRYPLFAVLPLFSLALLLLSPELGGICLLASLGNNVFQYFAVKNKTSHQLESLQYFARLLGCARKLAPALAEKAPRTAALLEEACAPLKEIKFGASGGDGDSMTGAMVELLNMLTLFSIIQYNHVIGVLRKNLPAAQRVYQLLGEVDAAISVVSYRRSLPLFCRPEFVGELRVEAQDLTHPLLADPVENSAGITQCWLLTGSNASGKSTFIKSVAVNLILAQTINTCTAARFVMRRAAVITSMAVADNIVDGESYFIAEIKSMRRILAYADTGAPCYCFIDEILKGTNTVERVAASATVLAYLQRPNCLCMAATHDIELTKMLEKTYRNMHFSEQVSEEGVTFDYLLKDGPSTTRNAIKLLEYYGFPAAVVTAANAAANKAEAEKGVQT